MHQHTFGLIVGVMRDGDGIAANPLRDLGQKAIAHLARGFFDGKLFTPGVGRHITRLDRAGQPPFASQLRHERCIFIGIHLAQLVVEMRHLER